MPQITSPLSTPTGMPALNSAHLGKAAGLRIHFALFSDFTAAITTGTSSYAADLWADGQEMTIASEADSGAVRVWRTALGHARTVKVGRLEVVLPANTNVVLAAAGVPAAGTGANGDLSVDKAAGIAYLKAAGAWTSAGKTSGLSTAAAAAVQAAFDAGYTFGSAIVTLTTSRSTASSDNGGTLVYSGSSDIVLTFAAGMPAGFSCTVIQAGMGKVSATQGAGVGFDNAGSTQGLNTFFTAVMGTADQYAFQNPVPSTPVTLLQTAIPFIRFSSWTFGANGALTLAVALPTTFPAAYVYFPADAIATGVPAGWYYTVFSSTSAGTAGTVYNNQYTTGDVSIPASPSAFSASAGSVTTQITTAITGPNKTLPGGSLGANGYLNSEALWHSNNSANTKATLIALGSSTMTTGSMSSSNIVSEVDAKTQCAGVVNRQTTRSATINSQTATPTYLSADTSTDLSVAEKGTLATAATGDYVILVRLRVSYCYGA